MRDVSGIWGLDPQFLGQRSTKPPLLGPQCPGLMAGYTQDLGIGAYVRFHMDGIG